MPPAASPLRSAAPALLLLSRRADVMGRLVDRPVTTAAAALVASVILALNAFLVLDTLPG